LDLPPVAGLDPDRYTRLVEKTVARVLIAVAANFQKDFAPA
jgi:hypothetical protein